MKRYDVDDCRFCCGTGQVYESVIGNFTRYADHLEAVKQARADALRLVLEHIGKTAPRHIDSRVYSIVDDEIARLRAIIEKELSK